MDDFDLNDMVDFFAKDKKVKVLVFDEEGIHEVKGPEHDELCMCVECLG